MLYVFHVDTGTMMTFDMNLALESVSSLQGVIAKGCRISEDKQVLLVSGGESLDPSATVGKYHAGTDTNPIFLFSKSTIEAATPPSPSVNYGSDIDLQGQVEGSLLMPPAYETVVSRAQLALQFQEVDAEELRACERLIHDQHLQQQGWAAVVANLEDVTSELQSRSHMFQESYAQYLSNRESYRAVLTSVSGSLQLLSKIPVLSCLSRPSSSVMEQVSDEERMTLFDWISSQDTNHSLQDMVEQCVKATEQMDQNVGEALQLEVDQMFADVHNPSMKEVKGLEDRLYGLDQIMSGARKIVHEQSDLAQGFVHNQNRVSNLQDRSILPDLCSSHKNQLVEMLKNHKRLREIKKKCRMAKEELSVNLHTRLRWVMYVEKKICDVDGKLTIYHGNLKRLSKRLDILQQVHDAPRVYAQLVVEVVRRRLFSRQYLNWAASLAEDSNQLHVAEVRRRESFLVEVGRHFLQSLFQGFEDYPPLFATEAPAEFDQNLPVITSEDINMLKSTVPELSGVLSVPSDVDLFEGFHTLTKDSSVQWVERSDQDTLHVPRTTSVTGSDIDIIHSDHNQLVSLEGGSMSLGENLAECQQETEILVKPDVGPLSPADKTEFLLPKSLSEALTKEMKEEKRKSVEYSGKVSESKHDDKTGTLETSGSTDKTSITESDSQSQGAPSVDSTQSKPTQQRDKSGRVVIISDTSPDMETSQEFTTADFYIDESMPSSIADSPPNKASTEDKRSPEQLLQAEKQQTEKLQKELKDCELKVTILQCKLKSLKETCDDKLSSLKTVMKDFSQLHEKGSEEFKKEFEKLKGDILSVIVKFDSNMNADFKDSLHKLDSERNESEKDLNEKLQHEVSKCMDLTSHVQELEFNMKTLTDLQAQKLLEVIEEKDKIEAQCKEELVEMKKKHELEQEIELDKLRSVSENQMQNLERKVEESDALVKSLEERIERAQKDRIKTEETLLERHQQEKDEILGIIEKEYELKLEAAIQVEREKVDTEKQNAIETLTSEYEEKMKEKLQELKLQLASEKKQEIQMTQSALTLEHSKQTDEIKLKMQQEKCEELKKLEEEIQIKYQENLAKFSTEFNQEKEKLMSELKKFTDRRYEDSTNQTESVSDQTESECQTDSQIMCESSFQTDTQQCFSASMQTDAQEKIQLSTQTDVLEQSNTAIQTDKQTVIQPDIPQLNTSMQTEPVTISQTDFLQQTRQDVQTERQESSHDGTQTVIADSYSSSSGTETQSDKLDALKLEYEAKLKAQEEQHESEISELISKLEKEKEDSQQLKSSLTSMMGDKQVKFNEAVNRVSQDKDRVIEELKKKEKEFLEQQAKDKVALEQALEEVNKAVVDKERVLSQLQEKEQEFSVTQRQLESDLEMSKQQLTQYQQQLQSASEQSVSTSPSVVRISDPDEVDLQQKIRELEDMVRLKDEELLKMQQKVMELSMTASTRSLVQDKVSITSCQVGDLVLLCLDDRLDQYVVFTVGTTLHFLHTDCLPALGIKHSPGDVRKQWLLAEVTDKEYCQAKKANNRFKVPIGTKFYRVKARPWTRESAQSKKSDITTASASSQS